MVQSLRLVSTGSMASANICSIFFLSCPQARSNPRSFADVPRTQHAITGGRRQRHASKSARWQAFARYGYRKLRLRKLMQGFGSSWQSSV